MELIALSAALVAVIATVIVAIHVQHLEDDLRLLWGKVRDTDKTIDLFYSRTDSLSLKADELNAGMKDVSERIYKQEDHVISLSAEIVKMQERIGDVEENNDASKAIMEGFTNIMSFSSQKGKGEE